MSEVGEITQRVMVLKEEVTSVSSCAYLYREYFLTFLFTCTLREDDIAELLKFEKKHLRARLTLLKNDKFIHARLKMETGPDGKAHKVNYFFINYKTFVNVIKYKLDLMRKRLETEERDATSRASFKCTNCSKAFTDLEVNQLFDFESGLFSCLFCGKTVVNIANNIINLIQD